MHRSLVIHSLPDDLSRVNKQQLSELKLEDNSRILSCGLIRPNEIESLLSLEEQDESILRRLQKPYPVHRIEESILNGEKPWENVRHPYYGASQVEKNPVWADQQNNREQVPSNLNLEGVERQDREVDSLTLETSVPTRKGMLSCFRFVIMAKITELLFLQSG